MEVVKSDSAEVMIDSLLWTRSTLYAFWCYTVFISAHIYIFLGGGGGVFIESVVLLISVTSYFLAHLI